MPATRAVWVPLRSNVAYFETTGSSLPMEGRIKSMAILSEQLYFEAGLLDVAVMDEGLTSFWIPPDDLSAEDIARRRQRAEIGEPVHFAVGLEDAPGIPAPPERMRTVLSGALQRAFVAEFHTLFDSSGLSKVEWANLGFVPQEVRGAVEEIARGEDTADLRRHDDAPRLSENNFLDDRLKKDLNRDLAAGAVMGIPVGVDDLHGSMLTHKAARDESRFREQSMPGSAALDLWVPDFTEVAWPDILALHDHDAIGGFREALIAAEEQVSHLAEPDRTLALKDHALDALAERVRELLPTKGRIGVDIGSSLVLDLVSGLFPLGGTVAASLKGLGAIQREQAEWTAILLTLRSRANDSKDRRSSGRS